MISIVTSSVGENRKLAEQIWANLSERRVDCQLVDLVECQLPLYSSIEEAKGIPEAVIRLSGKLKESDGFLFVAPEYNGGIPPVLVNAITWVSRSGKDWREAFNGKVAALATYSGGGGAYVLSAMRNQLSYLGMNLVGRQLLTNSKRPLAEMDLDSVLDQLLSMSHSLQDPERIC
ncbi:MAG: NAD(P)H-dependent oxidoreductase [Bdellovibrionales bacterium]|nr:NAD(P)H-dependent oxidoreductase [Bdellovibrionales bacterium]